MKMYEVGGCVRDEILGLRSKDIDYTVVLEEADYQDFGDPFKAMAYRLVDRGFKIFLETPEYFTVRAQFPKIGDSVPMPPELSEFGPTGVLRVSSRAGLTADFVLARKEGTYTDGRRPDRVEVGTLEDDLARRDFTMNAIAKDENGYYTDPYNGRQDIRDGLIRAVGDPVKRLTEDALRAVRALRFAVTKNFAIDSTLADAMESREVWYNIINKISDERIQVELSKMFRFDTEQSLIMLSEFPSLRNAVFSGTVSLDATMKTKGKGK